MTATTPIAHAWIAADWGTSNLRVFAMDAGGKVLAQAASEQGMATLTKDGYEPALRALIADWSLPNPCTVIACGMVGSRQGWFEAPYRSVPCIAATEPPVHVPECGADLDVYLLPGVRQDTPADVMRGEETQIAGFLHLNPDWDGVLCLPGTHSKWVQVSAGEIVSFRTCMTGELFNTISSATVLQHSLAKASQNTTDWDTDAFTESLKSAQSRPETLVSSLFTLRAADLLHSQSSTTASAKLSGLLIGAELAATKPYWLGTNVAIIGNDTLAGLYCDALKLQGITAERCDSTEVTCAGIFAAFSALKA
jgi:2-dehydro-3-deoxygalactonokinase